MSEDAYLSIPQMRAGFAVEIRKWKTAFLFQRFWRSSLAEQLSYTSNTKTRKHLTKAHLIERLQTVQEIFLSASANSATRNFNLSLV